VEVDVEVAVEELRVAVNFTLHHVAVLELITSDEDTTMVDFSSSNLAAVTPIAVAVLAGNARAEVALEGVVNHLAAVGRSQRVSLAREGLAINASLGAGTIRATSGEEDGSFAARLKVAIGVASLADVVAETGLLVEELRVILWVADAIRDEGINVHVDLRIVEVLPEQETIVAIDTS
jgi:hypothetical protein